MQIYRLKTPHKNSYHMLKRWKPVFLLFFKKVLSENRLALHSHF